MNTQLIKRIVDSIVKERISNPSDRNEVLQDICIKLYTSFDGYHEKGFLTEWVKKIATNVCNDYYRQKAVQMKRLKEYSEDYKATVLDDNKRTLLQREIFYHAREKLLLKENITFEDKILKCYLVDELSVAEISRILNISRKVVTRVRDKERKKLQSLFQRLEGFLD